MLYCQKNKLLLLLLFDDEESDVFLYTKPSIIFSSKKKNRKTEKKIVTMVTDKYSKQVTGIFQYQIPERGPEAEITHITKLYFEYCFKNMVFLNSFQSFH